MEDGNRRGKETWHVNARAEKLLIDNILFSFFSSASCTSFHVSNEKIFDHAMERKSEHQIDVLRRRGNDRKCNKGNIMAAISAFSRNESVE